MFWDTSGACWVHVLLQPWDRNLGPVLGTQGMAWPDPVVTALPPSSPIMMQMKVSVLQDILLDVSAFLPVFIYFVPAAGSQGRLCPIGHRFDGLIPYKRTLKGYLSVEVPRTSHKLNQVCD